MEVVNVNLKKTIEPNTEPSGTPQGTCVISELVLPRTRYCSLLDKYDLNQFNILPRIPYCSSLYSRIVINSVKCFREIQKDTTREITRVNSTLYFISDSQ